MSKRTLFLSVVLFVAACDSTSIPAEDAGIDALVPLAVGNEWIWRTVERSTHRGEVEETVRFDTVRVVSDTSLLGESWFRLRERNGEYLVANRPSGYWQRMPPEAGDGNQLLVYKYPAVTGDLFTRPSWPDSSEKQVMSLDTTITVPAGTFSAVHYAQIWNDKPITCDYFVAPGVGLVKKVLPWIEIDSGDIIRVDTQELIRFTSN